MDATWPSIVIGNSQQVLMVRPLTSAFGLGTYSDSNDWSIGMTDRSWNFEEDSNGRPVTPSTPPVAPSRSGHAGMPPLGAPAPINGTPAQTAVLPAYQSQQDVSSLASRATLSGPPLLGAANQSPDKPPKQRVGLRIFAAFLAGGVLTGGGFVAGEYVTNDTAQTIEPTATPVIATDSSQPVPDIILTPPDTDITEPASFVSAVLGPSIVQINTELGVGSGIVFEDGLVMTNHHVIANAVRIEVRTADGRTLPAELIGSDSRVDIAVLDVGEGSGLQPAVLALDEPVEVGQAAFALGSPFELQQSISAGIVSAINRPVINGEGYNAMIQSDTSVNPGNSGGALADRSGRVIGINTSIRTDGVVAGSVGISFSIPIDTAMNTITRIINGESLAPGFLGVQSPPGSTGGDSGVVIDLVTPGSAADAAGILPGDRVIRIEGTPVTQLAELAGLVRAYFPGDVVELEIVRGEERLLISATLGER